MTTKDTFVGCGFSYNNKNNINIRIFSNYTARLKMLQSCAHTNINIVHFANNVTLTKVQCVQYMLNNAQFNNASNAKFVAILQAYANKHINSVASVASIARIANITVCNASNANYNLNAKAVNANATTATTATTSASTKKVASASTKKVASTKNKSKNGTIKETDEFTL